MTVDVSYAGVTAPYGPARTLEFEAVFTGPKQWVGFAADTNLNTTPWALFGTFDSGVDLYADTQLTARTQVMTGGLGVAHRFRIDWSPGIVTYYIDGSLVATHNVDITLPMRPIIADNAADNPTLSADWLRMGPYAPATCIYTSHLFDSGIAAAHWITLTTNTDIPTNTAASFETRSGNTINPDDGTWSAWQTVAGSIASPDQRYLQYRALLTTTDSLATPRVHSVQPQGTTPTAIHLSTMSGQSTYPTSSVMAGLPLAMAAVLAGIAVGWYLRRSQQAMPVKQVGAGAADRPGTNRADTQSNAFKEE